MTVGKLVGLSIVGRQPPCVAGVGSRKRPVMRTIPGRWCASYLAAIFGRAMRILVAAGLAAVLAGSVAAQATVDVVTFTPPPGRGWQRAEQSGMVSYTTSGNVGGRPTYCQI